MIEAIGTASGFALTLHDHRAQRQRPRAMPRRRGVPPESARAEIDDALAADALDDRSPSDEVNETIAGGPTVTAAAVAQRLAGAADRALAMQARLGSAAVLRLVGADG